MTNRLKKLSVIAGFEMLVTTYAFRHWVAKALDSSGGTSSSIDGMY